MVHQKVGKEICGTAIHPRGNCVHDYRVREEIDGDQVKVSVWPKAFQPALNKAMRMDPGPLRAAHVVLMMNIVRDRLYGYE